MNEDESLLQVSLPPELQARENDASAIFVEVVTVGGRAEAVELRIRIGNLEVWRHGRCCATFDRSGLRSWLANGHRPLAAGEAILSRDPRSDGERVAISLPDVIAWNISPSELNKIRDRV